MRACRVTARSRVKFAHVNANVPAPPRCTRRRVRALSSATKSSALTLARSALADFLGYGVRNLRFYEVFIPDFGCAGLAIAWLGSPPGWPLRSDHELTHGSGGWARAASAGAGPARHQWQLRAQPFAAGWASANGPATAAAITGGHAYPIKLPGCRHSASGIHNNCPDKDPTRCLFLPPPVESPPWKRQRLLPGSTLNPDRERHSEG